MKKICLFVSVILFVVCAKANDIQESDIMWKKRVIRAIDLREKQNRPLYAYGVELPKLLVDALKDGTLTPYQNDSLAKSGTLKLADCLETMKVPTNFIIRDTAFMEDWEKEEYLAELAAQQNNYYFARDLYQIELTEDLIFDKQRSVLYRKIRAITLYVPADHPDNQKGIQLPIASFDYDECKKLFVNSPRSFWFNRENDQTHLNFADAFELRLFSSYMIKVSNPENEYIVDTFGGDPYEGILGSHKTEFSLMEFEHNLWEY